MEDWLNSVYKKIPTNARLLGETLLGSNAPITEKDFTAEELAAIRNQVARQQERNNNLEAAYIGQLQDEMQNPAEFYGYRQTKDGKQTLISREEYIADLKNKIESFAVNPNKTSVRPYSRGEATDAGVGGGFFETVGKSFSSPEYNISTTLGRYNAYTQPDGSVVVKDTYDWAKTGGREPTLGEALQAMGRAFPNPEGMGNVAMRYLRPEAGRAVTVNLGKLND